MSASMHCAATERSCRTEKIDLSLILILAACATSLPTPGPPPNGGEALVEAFKVPEMLRIRVFTRHADDASRRLREAGFSPELERGKKDTILLVMRGLSEEDFFRAMQTVPADYIANRGTIGRHRAVDDPAGRMLPIVASVRCPPLP